MVLVSGVLAACSPSLANVQHWPYIAVDSDGPAEPWGKGAGDINGDGFPDLVVGGHSAKHHPLWRRALFKLGLLAGASPSKGELVWYESPAMQRHLVSDQFNFRTDIEVGDIDGDDHVDIVALTDDGIVWFKGPNWAVAQISSLVFHDIELTDLDSDGDLDIVARDQRRKGVSGGDELHVFRQQQAGTWESEQLSIAEGEGLAVADMDSDGNPDVVLNQFWMRNTGNASTLGEWTRHTYCNEWRWPDAKLTVQDLNRDGRPDVVLAPAEPGGSNYRLSWCEAPANDASAWKEHVLEPQTETLIHSLAAGDFNHDGLPDVVVAQMHQSKTGGIALYSQTPQNMPWRKSVLGTGGSHNMVALDYDLDGDLDLMGANWSGNDQSVGLWINPTEERTALGWRRHVVDPEKPWTSVFVMAADLNGDKLKDIVTGGWWYQNPGKAGDSWVRHTVGEDANNVALVLDVDGDDDLDLVSSVWADSGSPTMLDRLLRKAGLRHSKWPGTMVWAKNNGIGQFRVHHNMAPGQGDFLQGAALLHSAGTRQVAVSWHESGQGVQRWYVPLNPDREDWTMDQLSEHSQEEELTTADLDGDGVEDLLLGTRWLRNEGNRVWGLKVLHDGTGKPDRNEVADIDGDGIPDVVVGFEAIDAPGKLAWYSRGANPLDVWQEHLIATVPGPMSLGVADIDGDGDMDVVVGEHKVSHPESARIQWFENQTGDGRNWLGHIVHTGDEHHDGALIVDIDNDGDLDLVSIGWSHARVLLYENLAIVRKY